MVFAGTYTWTGAEDGFWTNANNWAEKAVPGQYYAPDGTRTGGLFDVAVFGDNLSGAQVTTVSFDGVYSISNLTTCGTATRYTYGATADEFIPIQPYGWFIGSKTSDTLVPTIACKLRLGVDCTEPNYATQQIKIQSENPNETLEIGPWGFRSLAGGVGTKDRAAPTTFSRSIRPFACTVRACSSSALGMKCMAP